MDENGRKRQTEWKYVRGLLKEEEEEEVNLIASSNKLQLLEKPEKEVKLR